MQAELEHTKQMLEDVETQNRGLNDAIDALREQVAQVSADRDAKDKEITNLRSRLNISQQNWNQERDELVASETKLREEYETTRQAMQDWEVVAMEERAVRESLGERVVELEEQLNATEETIDKAVADKERATATLAGKQRALEELQKGEIL